MKDSEILKKAKEIIVLRETHFICIAISAVKESQYSQRVALCAWIQHMLGIHNYYHEWLKFNHPDVYNDDRAYTSDFREARLAWLDWMIAECEKDGV